MAQGLLSQARPALTALGGLVVLLQAYKLAVWVNVHFLRHSSLKRYLKPKTGNASWALVTGATDGIGKGLAEELCKQGFNVVLHGRNESKLEKVKTDLLNKHPECQIRTLRIDASNEASSAEAFSHAAFALSDIELRVLVNNVGGTGGLPAFVPLSERTQDEVGTFIDMNARFPTEITRALLPQLRKNSPSLIVNIGSCTSEFGLPYLSVYSGTKSYNKGWSESLASEMQAEKTGIEVLCIMTSAVATENYAKPHSLFVPGARQYAKHTLDKVGCGKSVVFGYWAHQIQAVLFQNLPRSLARRAMIDVGKQEKAEEEKKLRSK